MNEEDHPDKKCRGFSKTEFQKEQKKQYSIEDMEYRSHQMQTKRIPSPYRVINRERKCRDRPVIVAFNPGSRCRIREKYFFYMRKVLCQDILVKEMIIIPNKLIPKRRKIGKKANNAENGNEFSKR